MMTAACPMYETLFFLKERKSILLGYCTTTALSGAFSAGNLLGLWVGDCACGATGGASPLQTTLKVVPL
jgi:hypothetical protein